MNEEFDFGSVVTMRTCNIHTGVCQTGMVVFFVPFRLSSHSGFLTSCDIFSCVIPDTMLQAPGGQAENDDFAVLTPYRQFECRAKNNYQ
jgi:hypothetical protein